MKTNSMKACFSVLIVIILIPVLFVSIFLSLINNTVFDENFYRTAFNEPDIKKEIEDFTTYQVRDSIAAKSDLLKSIVLNSSVENAIRKFTTALNINIQIQENLVGVIKYIKGQENNLSLYARPVVDEKSFTDFKNEILISISDGIISMAKCSTDAEYNSYIDRGESPKCRAPSLSSQVIVSKINELVDKSFSVSLFQDILKAKIPVGEVTLNRINQLKEIYTVFQNVIFVSWIITAFFTFILIIMNVIHGFTFFSYLKIVVITVSLPFIGLTLLFSAIRSTNYFVVPADLGMSTEFSSDSTNTAADLANSLGKFLFEHLYTIFLYVSISLILMAVVMILLNYFIKKSGDRKLFKRQYVIPAYTIKKPEIPQDVEKQKE